MQNSFLFSLASALPSRTSAGRPGLPLFGSFIGVGSEEARSEALASVRRTNCTDGFPVYSFHDDARPREAIEGIEWTFFAPVGLIQSASLLGRAGTGLSSMELFHQRRFTHWRPFSSLPSSPAVFPGPFRRRLLGHEVCRPASGTTQPSAN